MHSRDRNPVCLALSLLILAGMANWSTARAQRRAVRPPSTVQESTEQILQILPLRYVEADALVRTLANLLRGVTLAIDARTNSLIVQADAEQLDRVKALLEALDVPAKPKETAPDERDRQVRVIWLMSGLKEGGAAPPDLKPITEELGNYGVAGLQLVAQTIVRGRDRFTTSAYPDLDGRPVQLEIAGTFSPTPPSEDTVKMEISVSASTTTEAVTPTGGVQVAPSRASRESLAELQTTVVAPFGHPVVLCMTPVKKMTSVFIVQVLPTR